MRRRLFYTGAARHTRPRISARRIRTARCRFAKGWFIRLMSSRFASRKKLATTKSRGWLNAWGCRDRNLFLLSRLEQQKPLRCKSRRLTRLLLTAESLLSHALLDG